MQDQGDLFPEDRERKRRSRIFGTIEFKQAYSRYISSSNWKKLCRAVRARAKNHCERCNNPKLRLDVHHVTYKRFQAELLTDLQCLCKACHEIADEERRRENHRKFAQAREDARYAKARETYFKSKYGDEWESHYDEDGEQMDEDFDSWLEEKQERFEDEY